MAWTGWVSGITPNDWSDRYDGQIYAVTVDHQIFIFALNHNLRIDVFLFNPKTYTCTVIHSAQESINEDLAPKCEILHFAVACKEKVYLCIRENVFRRKKIDVFDTRSLRWSCLTTSGDLPLDIMWVHGCADDAAVYMCAYSGSMGGVYLWVLDMSNLRWNIVTTAVGGRDCTPHCVVAYNNRIYIVYSDELIGARVSYYDLTTNTMIQLLGTSPYSMVGMIHLIHRGELYVFNDIRRSNVKQLDYLVVKYSFAQNNWLKVELKGVTTPDAFQAGCIVDNVAIFFSLSNKKAYILDFLPSLRNLCFYVVCKYQLSTFLPAQLERELSYLLVPF